MRFPANLYFFFVTLVFKPCLSSNFLSVVGGFLVAVVPNVVVSRRGIEQQPRPMKHSEMLFTRRMVREPSSDRPAWREATVSCAARRLSWTNGLCSGGHGGWRLLQRGQMNSTGLFLAHGRLGALTGSLARPGKTHTVPLPAPARPDGTVYEVLAVRRLARDAFVYTKYKVRIQTTSTPPARPKTFSHLVPFPPLPPSPTSYTQTRSPFARFHHPQLPPAAAMSVPAFSDIAKPANDVRSLPPSAVTPCDGKESRTAR